MGTVGLFTAILQVRRRASIHCLSLDAFQANYKGERYQFAFLAYHMLTMSFVYCNVWQIKNILANDFSKAMVGFNKDVEKELLQATSPFTFSRVNESVIFRFLKLIGCDNSQIGQYTRLVKDRNEIAHCNGNIFYDAPEMLDEKISDTLQHVEQIEAHSAPLILCCYESFLEESHDPEEREYIDEQDQIRESLIHRNYLSQKDIEICLGFEIANLANEPLFEEMRSFHHIFVETYQQEYEKV
jgi:hypothetical protein